jgi:glycosyltransferase involved in cell wall biosynthesis
MNDQSKPVPGVRKPRLLVLVLTYEAARHIADVVARIPGDLDEGFATHVLVLDDASADDTPAHARDALIKADLPYSWSVLVNSVNQGYGGNQKLGYRYAIDNCFDVVVMVHGDGQYPPEQIAQLATLALGAGAAFGTRFAQQGAARAGGMPRYKWLGNRILTAAQNRLLGTRLTEFHSGFRAYRTDVLEQIPFHLNSDDFHFDTEIFIQILRAGSDIAETPIPTRYGDEKCRVNGIYYARKVFSQTLRAALHDKGLFYERKFDNGTRVGLYESKLGFTSPAQLMLDTVTPGSSVFDLGCSDGHLAAALRHQGCRVIGVDLCEPTFSDRFDRFITADLNDGIPEVDEPVDVVLLADIIEHLRSPEQFVGELARFCMDHHVKSILVSTGNVAFLGQRLALALGQFNYGQRGILDMTHTRLFTARTLRRLFYQAGFDVRRRVGLPAPYPLAIARRKVADALLQLNSLAIRVSPTMFSYQIFLYVEPPSDLAQLVAESARHAGSAAGRGSTVDSSQDRQFVSSAGTSNSRS